MSSRTGSGGGGGVGLIGFISGIYAYATIPSLTGLKGVFGAAMVGMGTSLYTGVCLLSGGVIGGLAGAAIGAPFKAAKQGAVVGALVTAVGAGIWGIPNGYGEAKDLIVNGTLNQETMSEVIHEPANDNSLTHEYKNTYSSTETLKGEAPLYTLNSVAVNTLSL